ncbi:MAG TPA: DUF6510 family protein [Gaiellaceae bacterium]|nr:DUF6510 family protein [Gaiellaceae bacterium]
MNALDGNAMAGILAEALGSDVSGSGSCCADCGATAAVGAQRAWLSEAGAVLRCHACDAVLLVVVSVRGGVRVSFDRLAWLAVAAPAARESLASE